MENFKKEKKLDRRTKYTKDIIKKSLLKMVKKKPFEKITVTEICKICEINRGTFYIHYCFNANSHPFCKDTKKFLAPSGAFFCAVPKSIFGNFTSV